MKEPTDAPPGDARPAAPDPFDARTLWDTMIAVSEAACALKKARDLVIAVQGNTLAASTLYVLHEATQALALEMGATFRRLATSPDPETRTFVALVLDRLHGPQPATVPPPDGERTA